jgi:hypothetical protein
MLTPRFTENFPAQLVSVRSADLVITELLGCLLVKLQVNVSNLYVE